MTQPSEFSGGQSVKASSLRGGDFVRDPKKADRILVIIATGGASIYARGLDEKNREFHRFFNKDEMVIRVTNVLTETSILPKEGESA